MQLSTRTRINITRWAQEYVSAISGLVESNQGDSEDVRSIIHDLHYQSTVIDHDGGL